LSQANNIGRWQRPTGPVFAVEALTVEVATVSAFTVSAIVRSKLAAFLGSFFAHRHKNSPMGMEDVNVVAV
jgi:hypothetical protein